jgi:hypothetical protein
MNQQSWSEEIEAYVDPSVLEAFCSETLWANVEANVRLLCLNFWLQSARKVRYNLRAEARNG